MICFGVLGRLFWKPKYDRSGRGWRQRHQFFSEISSFLTLERKYVSQGILERLLVFAPCPPFFQAKNPEITVPFGEQRHIPGAVHSLQPCSPTQTVPTVSNKKAQLCLCSARPLAGDFLIANPMGPSPFPEIHPTARSLLSYLELWG